MDFYPSNLVLHIKRIVYSSIRLGYQYTCDYPVVLGAGILLLFLHKLCPSLFRFLLSSSPVFLLTALLLGALLTYGEPCAPVIGEEALENQQTMSPKSKISATHCSTEIENTVAVAYVDKSFESQVVCTEEKAVDRIVHDTRHNEEKVTSILTDVVLCAEEFSEFTTSNVIVETEEQKQQQQRQQSLLVPSNVIVETEERTKEISGDVDLQDFGWTNTESYHNEMHNRYQFGELMSSCWQPVMKQDPCSDSESDISGSSSDASMTDIIPMLDELNPPVNLGSGNPSSAFREGLNSSSDDEDDSEEDGDHGSDGAEEQKNDENNSEENNNVHSSDMKNVSNADSLIERRRAKNILKFELDKRLMDMQAADAAQKMEEASRFRVQVPSISTPRPKPSDPSNGSDETIELPQIPDSAPSVIPGRKPFDIPFDQIVDGERKLQETWTPRSYFPSRQHRKHGNLYLRQSTYLQHHDGVMVGKPEVHRNDAYDSRSDSDSEQTGNNGKLFGSLEAHMGEEIKIISAAISDACVLEANCEVDEGTEQLTLLSLSKGNHSEQHIVEADSISEANLLFKSRMEEVLVQSISESGIGQPLTVKLEDELSLSDTLSADPGMPIVEASSAQELNLQISQLTKGSLTCAAYDYSCDNESVQDRSSGSLPTENGHSSLLPIEDGRNSDSTVDEAMAVKFEGKPNELFTDCGELPVLEASSVEDMNSSFKKIEEETQEQIFS
ncbi:hypothetical protein QOZ80_9AG0673320 [Eleusine coracana subsp. coracana]|nr:hypothetical protein QOZ80_9AG0673320 [Eleusine coracana subsp. coracana]